MRRDAHPLRPAQIEPVSPDPFPLDDTAKRLQRRIRGSSDRALPTMRTTRGIDAWRFGKSVERKPDNGPPVILSPSDLEHRSDRQESNCGDLDELRRRLGRGGGR